ncbi:MAG: hypothetical protein CMP21_03090 [Rickettsiales bacterium]|nr:hypothetical protein [Rickettsiales bacterium]|tara:strand:+ start:11974 stop:12432 length:459 start_codon:yes stop_codon:yes gene_type:complete
MTQIEGHGLGSIQNNDNKNQKSQANNDFDINFDKILAELVGEQEEVLTQKKKKAKLDPKESIQKPVKAFYNTVVEGGISGINKNEIISKERYQELFNITSDIIKIQLPNLNNVSDIELTAIEKNEPVSKKRYQELNNLVTDTIKTQLPDLEI